MTLLYLQIKKKYSHVDLVHMVGGADLERGANVAGTAYLLIA